MYPTPRIAGVAGVIAGVGLAIEAMFWSASGWTPQTFGDPQTALAFLRDSGSLVRTAVFAGAINLVFTIILIAGLAGRLRASAPNGAAATLLFGLIGVAAHGLVPLGLWLGIPMLLTLAGGDAMVAQGAWGGFAVFIAAAGGVGGLFLGLSTLAAGSAGVAARALPAVLGWLGIVAGAASVVTVLAANTPLGSVAGAAYLPSLLLAIVFRTWAGIELWRKADQDQISTPRPAAMRR